jgi:hypothetical protein
MAVYVCNALSPPLFPRNGLGTRGWIVDQNSGAISGARQDSFWNICRQKCPLVRNRIVVVSMGALSHQNSIS